MFQSIRRWLHEITDPDRLLVDNGLRNRPVIVAEYGEEVIKTWLISTGWAERSCSEEELDLAVVLIAEGREARPLNALDTAHAVLEAQSNA